MLKHKPQPSAMNINESLHDFIQLSEVFKQQQEDSDIWKKEIERNGIALR